MAADIVAVPANLYSDKYFDMIIGSFPVWFWILLVIVMCVIFLNFWFLYKRNIMVPVLEYLHALKLGKPQTLFLAKNRAFSIKYLEYTDSVLAYEKISDISKWLVQTPKNPRLGGLSTMLVRDNYDYSVDPIAEIAICKLASDWNKKYSETNPMNCYNDFVKLRDSGALEDEYPDGIVIPLYNIYDPALIQKYLPQGRSAGIFGSHLTQKALELRTDKNQEKWYEKYVPVGVAMTISIMMLVLSYMFAGS